MEITLTIGIIIASIVIYSFYKFKEHEKCEKLYQRSLAEIALNNRKEALKFLDKLIEERTYWQDYNLRGTIHQTNFEYKKAYQDYCKSIELQPNANINGASYIGREEVKNKLPKETGLVYEKYIVSEETRYKHLLEIKGLSINKRVIDEINPEFGEGTIVNIKTDSVTVQYETSIGSYTYKEDGAFYLKTI